MDPINIKEGVTTEKISEPAKPILEIRNLCKNYGSFQAVDRLQITLREGEIYGFLGRNGAGKTTTIRMLMGIIKPTRGEIDLFGKRTRFHRNPKYKQDIGYVSQEQFFYPWMTCEGIGKFVGPMYRNWSMNEYDLLLQKMELPPERKIRDLSHGMKVKLALALAISHRPRLLILDEPTAGLDPVTRRDFIEMILHQRDRYNRTVFFSTHLLDEIERAADTVGVIAKGHMRFEGPRERLEGYVRLVTLPSAQPLEPALLSQVGLEVLRKTNEADQTQWFLAGPPEAFARLPAGIRAERLPLEDVFIELSGKARVDL